MLLMGAEAAAACCTAAVACCCCSDAVLLLHAGGCVLLVDLAAASGLSFAQCLQGDWHKRKSAAARDGVHPVSPLLPAAPDPHCSGGSYTGGGSDETRLNGTFLVQLEVHSPRTGTAADG